MKKRDQGGRSKGFNETNVQTHLRLKQKRNQIIREELRGKVNTLTANKVPQHSKSFQTGKKRGGARGTRKERQLEKKNRRTPPL